MNSKIIVALALCAVLLLVSVSAQTQSSGAGRVVIFRARTQPISPIKRVAKKHSGNGLPKNIPVVSKQTGGLIAKQPKKPKATPVAQTPAVVKTAVTKKRNAGLAKQAKASVPKQAKKAKKANNAKKQKSASKKLNKKRATAKKSKKSGSKKGKKTSKKGKKRGSKKGKKCEKRITATEHKQQIAKISKLLGGKKGGKKCVSDDHVKKALRDAKKHTKLAKKANKKASNKFAKFADKFKKQITSNFKKLAGCKKAKKAKKVRKCTKKQTYLEVLEQLRNAQSSVRKQIEEWAKPVRAMDAKSRKAAIKAMKQRIPREFHHYLELANGDKAEGKLVKREDKRKVKVDDFIANGGKNNKTNDSPSGPTQFSGFQIKVHVD